jgi:glycerol-3-phosphate acyltransferase PlsY
MVFFLYLLAAYFIGSINFSILLFKILKREDPRIQFSGNAGVTNVYRQTGPWWATIVLMLDAGRAISISLAALYGVSPSEIPWVGLSLVLGNRYPFFHQFKGGKGVANYLGFTAAITPFGASFAALTWIISFWIVRIPFIASFFMVFFLAGATIVKWSDCPLSIIGSTLTMLFIIFNHRQNIQEFRERKKTVKQ